MYAIVKIAGRQYRTEPNAVLKVNRLDAPPGSEVAVSEVMLVADGEQVQIGAPYLPYRARLEVLDHKRYPKVFHYTFFRRGGMRKLHGHRQQYSVVKVKAIEKGDN
jgi:large subunit ribosomal protein L21